MTHYSRSSAGVLDGPIVDSTLVKEHEEVEVIELGDLQLPESSQPLVTLPALPERDSFSWRHLWEHGGERRSEVHYELYLFMRVGFPTGNLARCVRCCRDQSRVYRLQALSIVLRSRTFSLPSHNSTVSFSLSPLRGRKSSRMRFSTCASAGGKKKRIRVRTELSFQSSLSIRKCSKLFSRPTPDAGMVTIDICSTVNEVGRVVDRRCEWTTTNRWSCNAEATRDERLGGEDS